MATTRWRAELGQLAAIRSFVVETSRSLGAAESAIADLELAVDEICTNSIQHGYGGEDGEIELTVERDGPSIRVVVRDWGGTFDPGQVPTPDLELPLEERLLGGLGLFLVRKLMDDVRFEFSRERGNSVTMVRRLDRGGKVP